MSPSFCTIRTNEQTFTSGGSFFLDCCQFPPLTLAEAFHSFCGNRLQRSEAADLCVRSSKKGRDRPPRPTYR